MAYYKDFSQYQYMEEGKEKNTVNIGWLGDKEDFKKGQVSEEFLRALWEYIKYPIHRKRGWHTNKGLDVDTSIFVAECEGYDVLLGTYEIRVLSLNKCLIYASPSMILHYIIDHHYLPPKEYMDAVINGPKPDTIEYCTLVHDIYSKYRNMEGKAHCPFCKKQAIYSGLWQEKNYKEAWNIKIKEYKVGDRVEQLKDCEYNKYLICKSCGKRWIEGE